MVAHVCAGTVFWKDLGNGRLIKIVVETNPNVNNFQDYLIYYGKDEKPAEAIARSNRLSLWFSERWEGLYTGV